jgi:hypothetical protein
MDAGKPAAAYQFQPQSGLAPRSRWWSPHQAKNRGCDVPATHRVRDTGSLRENVMQKAMTQMQDAGLVGGHA